MTSINNSNVGFSALQIQALKGTFARIPGFATFSIAPGTAGSNTSLVTIQLKDSGSLNIARVTPLRLFLSDSATGTTVTATTASGAVAAGAAGTDIVDLTPKKVKETLTNVTGQYILSITDTAKTPFYVVLLINNSVAVSPQLTTASYG